MTIEQTDKLVIKVEALKSIVTKLQEELTKQKLITQKVTEESSKIRKELHILMTS